MGTRLLAKLYWETEENGKRVWLRLSYTHARSYEEALDILLPRIARRLGLPEDGKYFLAWGKENSDASDVSKAVAFRLNKERCKRLNPSKR